MEKDKQELLVAAKAFAADNVDLYELLGLEDKTVTEQSVIQRAWRKASMHAHPDKARESFSKDVWERYGLARDVLIDEDARATYQKSRAAAAQRKLQTEALSAKRRRLKDELEEAERGAKRMKEDDIARQAELERERVASAAKGRAYMEERKRQLAEAEAREKDREKQKEENLDDKIRELERRLEEKARKKAEKKARKNGLPVEPQQSDATKTAEPSPKASESVPLPPPQNPRADPLIPTDQNGAAAPAAVPKPNWKTTMERLKAAEAARQERKRREVEAAEVPKVVS